MLLAVDARNRALSLGFREGGRWLAITRLGISPERSADEYALLLKSFCAEGGAAAAPSAVGVTMVRLSISWRSGSVL